MRSRPLALALAALAVATAVPSLAAESRPRPLPPSAPITAGTSPAALIEQNRGQYAPGVEYVARTAAGEVAFGARSLTFHSLGADGTVTRTRLDFAGAAPATVTGTDKQAAYVNHLVGERSRWRTHVPTFAGVRYEGLWPGVTLDLTPAANGALRPRWTLSASADASRVRWTGADFDGTPASAVHQLTATPDGEPANARPAPGQPPSGDAPDPSASPGGGVMWTRLFNTRVSEYTFGDVLPRLAVDARGFIYAQGAATTITASAARVAQPQRPHLPAADLYAAKLAPDGALVWLTLFGGSKADQPHGASGGVTPDGRMAFAVASDSPDFPVTDGSRWEPPAIHPDGWQGPWDTRPACNPARTIAGTLTRDGADLAVAASLGAWCERQPGGYAVRPDGAVIVTGFDRYDSVRRTPGAYGSPGADGDGAGYAAELGPDGRWRWVARFRGGVFGRAVGLDRAGNVLLAMGTRAVLPTTPGAARRAPRGEDVYLARLSRDGRRLLAASYVGGSAHDFPVTVGTAPDGTVALGGYTQSPSLPGGVRCEGSHLFAAALDAGLTRVRWARCDTHVYGALGGSVDDTGRVWLAGQGANGRRHFAATVVGYDPGGRRIAVPAVGGSRGANASAVVAYPGGGVIVAGATWSRDTGADPADPAQPLGTDGPDATHYVSRVR